MKPYFYAFACIIIIGCTNHGVRTVNKDAKKITLDTGIRFATALVEKRYADAHSMLTEELQRAWPAEKLRSSYEQMIAYMQVPATVDGHTEYLADWYFPNRTPNDIGWVYVSISGTGYAEAVTVVVSDVAGVPKIGHLEWGRP
jgi:hypothetical protein